MPRRQYQADLQKAVEVVSVAGISDVQPGADDGEFTFMCVADGQKVRISALVPELADYPTSHEVMIFGADNASSSVAAAIDDITGAASAKTISQILELVSSRLESTDRDGDRQMLDSQEFDDFGDEDEEEEEDEYFPGDEDMLPKPQLTHSLDGAFAGPHKEATAAFRQRIRRDLLIAKSEGFKVGHLGGLMDGLSCYVSLSIRISKLGISEEAMQAWQLEPSEYLVAIFHYPAGYKSMEDLKAYDTHQARRSFGVRIGICTTYKPNTQEAITAFTVLGKEEEKRREASQQADSQQNFSSLPKGFRNSFVSRPLNELLDQRFHLLLKYRYGGMPWHGAESFYNDQVLNASPTTEDASHDKYYMDEPVSNAWPKVVTDDHITSSMSQEHSLPLIGMQFVLRHFVRCTEFCLICFSKMPDDLQAIKPYVCDNPLCLYQYMSLGFGPSIEHEILSQPKVVDLLISFCYVSARNNRLKDFPTGLSLAVPPPVSYERDYLMTEQQQYGRYPPAQPAAPQPVATQTHVALSMRYNAATQEMLFENPKQTSPVTTGNWIVIRVDDNPHKSFHCRVVDTSLYPSVKVSEPVIPTIPEVPVDAYATSRAKPQQQSSKIDVSASVPANEFRSASFYIYNQNFDDLSDQQKRQAITVLLDLLPPVEEMKKYLVRKAHSSLGAWVDRLSPAAIGVLRWVIASNRACILQVDSGEDAVNGRKSEDRLYGMPGWAQFRFAMGAPDKERRFIQAVRDTTARLNLRYPTLFAWHGSPLQNWHSIIREGLHFNDTIHGRAYGNGVYHAPDVNTSLSYSTFGHGTGGSWLRSALRIQQALALNEIVNAPKEFVSQTPHLVVAQLDWIQTRYLFVMTHTDHNTAAADPETQPLDCVEQDPSRTPRGTGGNLVIPIHAIAASRRPKAKTTQKNKRQKPCGKSKYDPIEIDDEDDSASVTTFEEDRAIFDGDNEFNSPRVDDSLPTPNSIMGAKGKSKMGTLASFGSKLFGSKPTKPLTDYVPGTLDYSTLPMLQMPAWATSAATKRLMKDFKDVIQIQNKEPAHELGWHIDEDKIDNMYQWIVELHSFDPELPLANDMKKKDVKSIVLELRFGKDYPMSPPFVRVIRPRFLGFQQGGGGHVTAGGAMCMQLLTNDGWSAVSSIESVLLQVRMAISSREPKPARLQPGAPADYGVGEAIDAYMRACAVHGWTVPAGFREMANGGSEQASGRVDF